MRSLPLSILSFLIAVSAVTVSAQVGDLPETPSRGDVVAAVGSVSTAVRQCGGSEHGTAQVRLEFDSSGRLKDARIMGGQFSAPVQACILEAVRPARVSPFRAATFSVNYPFRL